MTSMLDARTAEIKQFIKFSQPMDESTKELWAAALKVNGFSAEHRIKKTDDKYPQVLASFQKIKEAKYLNN